MAKFKRNNLQLKTDQKIQFGDNQESVVQYDGSDLKLTNDGGELSLDANGITLNSGASVNQFSNDPALGWGINIVPTQAAVKSYVDTHIELGIESGNYHLSTGDTTAEVVFVQQQGSTNYGLGYSIINTVDNPPLLFVSGVFERTIDGFKVMFSSPMDTDNYVLSWIVTDSELGSSSSSSSSSRSSSSSSSLSSSSSSSATPPSELTFLLHAPASSNSEGVLLEVPGSQETFGDQGLTYIYRSAILPDGRVVIPVYDGGGPVVVNCYEAESTTAVDWSYEIAGSAYAYYSDVCVLTNGNIVVMWGDYDDYLPYFAILDSDGGLVKGVTSCSDESYEVEYSIPNHVIAMADGRFYCYWIEDSTYPAGSVWNADGTISVSYYYYDSDIEPAAPIQMPTGGVGAYSGWFVISQSSGNNALALVNPTDMSDYDTSIGDEISTYPDWVYMASPPAWTDRVAIVWTESSTTYYMILKDDGNTVSGWETLLSSTVINDLIQLPDGNLLMPYNNGSTEYGQSYYILDTSDDTELSILSGPHTAFTGLTANPDPACHGCAGGGGSPSISSSSRSSSSSSESSSSRSSSSSSSSTIPWMEVDEFSDITIVGEVFTVDTMIDVADSYVYRDFGADFFDDAFVIDFDLDVTALSGLGQDARIGVGVANTPDTLNNMYNTYQDGLWGEISGIYGIQTKMMNTDASDQATIDPGAASYQNVPYSQTYYYRLMRDTSIPSNDRFFFQRFTNPARTSGLYQIQHNFVDPRGYRYLIGISNVGVSFLGSEISCVLSNIVVVSH